jgi:delta14-sterol reductase
MSRPGALARVGVPALPLLLPPLVYYLWIAMDRHGGALPGPRALWRALPDLPLPGATSLAIFAAWLALQALLQLATPGPVVQGAPLEDGSRLPYRLNGWRSLWITALLVGGAVALGWLPPTLAARELGPLLGTVTVFSFLLGLYLQHHGRARPDEGRSDWVGPIHDFVLGTARNPRIGGFDLKLFFEARPGLIGWIALDLSLLALQIERHGAASNAMLLVVACQAFYVADYFFFEEAILSTWDIRHESFGWMLCFGDLVWVPFTYTLQAQYLVQHPVHLSTAALVGVAALNLSGYVVFRGANLQKHRFRRDPERPVWGRPPHVIRTAAGPLLLASGWWGLARHINYLGDLMMGLAWCLTCGFGHLLPYFYIVYFTALLVHRERRDHAACRRRYGADWQTYTARVRWRIVPGLY